MIEGLAPVTTIAAPSGHLTAVTRPARCGQTRARRPGAGRWPPRRPARQRQPHAPGMADKWSTTRGVTSACVSASTASTNARTQARVSGSVHHGLAFLFVRKSDRCRGCTGRKLPGHSLGHRRIPVDLDGPAAARPSRHRRQQGSGQLHQLAHAGALPAGTGRALRAQHMRPQQRM
jgi:hypothetical protein